MSQQNGYAFVGGFVKDGTVEYNIRPCLYLVASETGSNKYRTTDYIVVEMLSDGTLNATDIKTSSSEPGWALRIRDAVAAKLESIQSGIVDGKLFETRAKLAKLIGSTTIEQLEAMIAIMENKES